jgi:hypothetical protein
MDPKAARQLGVVDLLVAHLQIKRQFRSEPKRHGHQAPATLRGRRCRDLFPPGQADREFRPQRIHGFLHRLMIVFAVGRDARKIDEPSGILMVRLRRQSSSVTVKLEVVLGDAALRNYRFEASSALDQCRGHTSKLPSSSSLTRSVYKCSSGKS